MGDEDFAIYTATLQGEELGQAGRVSVRDALPEKLTEGGSEWEGVAADGSGRVFVLRESSANVFVFSPDLRELEHTIHLDLEESEDEHVRELLDDPNAGPEGMVLLDGGHLLVVKQRDPIVLVEFGRKDDPHSGLSGDSYLPPDGAFRLSDGRRTTLRALGSWELGEDAEAAVETANDLAVDGDGRLHAISSKSRCIFELGGADPQDGEVAVVNGWAIPEELEAGRERKAEGLAFDDQGRAIVALDAKDRGDNCFLLDLG